MFQASCLEQVCTVGEDHRQRHSSGVGEIEEQPPAGQVGELLKAQTRAPYGEVVPPGVGLKGNTFTSEGQRPFCHLLRKELNGPYSLSSHLGSNASWVGGTFSCPTQLLLRTKMEPRWPLGDYKAHRHGNK